MYVNAGRIHAVDDGSLVSGKALDSMIDNSSSGHMNDAGMEPLLNDAALTAFSRGENWRAWRLLGAEPVEYQGQAGTRFAVWAPNADQVSVIGDFNHWDRKRHPLRSQGDSGVWAGFVPQADAGAMYRFCLRNRDSGQLLEKIDPFARRCQARPDTASIVDGPARHHWRDADWLKHRPDWRHEPMAIYEVHAGSWRRNADGSFLGYRQLADALVEYLNDSHFTHVELMPITEHPLDASWGYQTTGYFAPTARFGNPDDLRYLIDTLHLAGIGVILDWVPAHFPRDAHALSRFDGTSLYEHADPRRGETAEWDTLAFNFGRHEVVSFLVSSALYWLEEFHFDGLRIDAVASMLYLDYGREKDEWIPNPYGGNEDLEAVAFLQTLNTVTHHECPGTFTIAEESTSWPGVTRPVHLGGLGFSMKWNMGWMHDTLAYMRHDPVHRRYHHDLLTFGMLYAYSENFVLPFSHDEVVHGKGPLIDRMPGDRWQRFANLRLLYAYQYAYPGKKLLFMGNEIGQPHEWSHDGQVIMPDGDEAAGLQRLVADLNAVYRSRSALHTLEFDSHGFEWIDCHDSEQSVISFLRRDGESLMVVVCNFTPVPRHGYRIGMPRSGPWREVLNTDAGAYGGSGLGNLGRVETEAVAWMGRERSTCLLLPPLAVVMFEPEAS
jgi:1,4-alpha-glucan branching enzyme